MSVHLSVSNSLFQLARLLSLELQQPTDNVFQPRYIVTQTEGMNSWLKLQIADQNGIAANCVFVSPNEIIQKVYYILGGPYPNVLSAQNMGWLIYSILGERDFLQRFPTVAAYYDHEDHDRDLKRIALAEKTADLFDQYQVYRPEWIEEWNQLEPAELGADQWQQYLWVRAKEISQERLPDKTMIGRFIREAAREKTKQQRLAERLPVIYLFGLSITTDYHLELLFMLSEIIDVHFHLVNPAPSVYWFEDRSPKQLAFLVSKGYVDKSEINQGNALLSSWGRVIQDTFMMLFSNEELLNHFEEVGVQPPGNDTLLHKIQQDIYAAASTTERNRISITDVSDGSLMISACYTVAREVEVLYNYLVHLVDRRQEFLSPRDIVVMVTNIDEYAPYIKAVFKNAPHTFHFTIADETYSSGDTLVSALESILTITRENFKAEEVLQLLDSSHIRKRFAIFDLSKARKMADAANIRFGMEGRSEDDTRFVSWSYGIKRIMYGICMSGGESYVGPEGEEVYPLDLVEGSESLEVIRFCHFAEVLMDSIKERDRPRTIAEWVDYTERLIQNLISEPDDEVEEDYVLLQEQLKNFNIASEFMQEPISFDIFRHSLLASVSGAGRSGSFAGGGITFCSLIPMRSIPFKVVALLGLNFDQFPRKEMASGFNLVGKDKRKRGDRNVKENDKHLFLDTVISAKDRLYLSYLGQSAKDNSTIPPSALIDELIDYISGGCEQPNLVRPALITRHPLHGFSRKYQEPGYYNYLDHKQSGGVNTRATDKAAPTFDFTEISLDKLIGWMKHPFKSYYNKVLDIYYREADALLSDTELFDLDALQKWALKSGLLSMPEAAVPALTEKLVKTGGLPLKNMATVTMNKLETAIAKVKSLFEACVGGLPEEKKAVSLAVGDSLITGVMSNVFGTKLVFVSYSKQENKYLLDAYIRYLVSVASGFDLEMYFISAENVTTYRAASLSPQDATTRLAELLQLYKKGHEAIIPYFDRIIIEPADIEELDEVMFDKAVEKYIHSFTIPCDDEYLLNEYRTGFFHEAGIVERYKAAATLLLTPLVEVFPEYYKK